jgi:16S rRNA (cytosine967-C5)-methyltransferase
VFSALVRGEASLPAVPTLPEAVRARWGERAEAIGAGLAVPPPLDLTLRDPATTEEWAGRLGAVSLAPGHLRIARGTAVEGLDGFAEGAWWVQDLAASLPARLLGAGEGRRVLDLCAAPGGKTMQLASAGWRVTAIDSSEKRLARMRENLARTGLEAELIAADVLAWAPEEKFDAVLLDAPCTATGTCRRHPEVLYRIGARQIAEMADTQRQLLARVSDWVAPGGRLVYAVCSLEAEEGEAVADAVELTSDPILASEVPAGIAPDDRGRLRVDPGMLAAAGGLDGFLIARWRR